jgi:hypothetical protein
LFKGERWELAAQKSEGYERGSLRKTDLRLAVGFGAEIWRS